MKFETLVAALGTGPHNLLITRKKEIKMLRRGTYETGERGMPDPRESVAH